jgi:hypothetical protein
MAPILVLFLFWLALHGRLKAYADFATSGPGWGALFPGTSTGSSAGPVKIVPTQPNVSTGQGIINNIMCAVQSALGLPCAPGAFAPGQTPTPAPAPPTPPTPPN